MAEKRKEEVSYIKKLTGFGRVNLEKEKRYHNSIEEWKVQFGLNRVEFFGLYFGSRGTVPKFFIEFCKKHGIPVKVAEEIAISILDSSIGIVRSHIAGAPGRPNTNVGMS